MACVTGSPYGERPVVTRNLARGFAGLFFASMSERGGRAPAAAMLRKMRGGQLICASGRATA